MIIAVKSCEKHWDRVKAIRETWGKSPMVYFFTGDFLRVPDDYAHLPHKTKAICQWTLRHNYDWAFLCDTDTYVSVPRLLKADQHTYMGYRLENKNYASGGAGYMLSRKAMEVVSQGNPDEFENEDEMVGTLLGKVGISVHHDRRFSLYQDVLPGNKVISRHLSSRGPFKLEMIHEAHQRANDRLP
jgi:hypothetical protein